MSTLSPELLYATLAVVVLVVCALAIAWAKRSAAGLVLVVLVFALAIGSAVVLQQQSVPTAQPNLAAPRDTETEAKRAEEARTAAEAVARRVPAEQAVEAARRQAAEEAQAIAAREQEQRQESQRAARQRQQQESSAARERQQQERERSAAEPPLALAPERPAASPRSADRAPVRSMARPEVAVAPPDPWDVVPVYYGTDRSAGSEAGRASYGSGRGKRLDLGRALVTVPKAHQVPQVERPWVYHLPFTNIVLFSEREDPKVHFTLKEVQALTKEQLLALVRERLAASQNYKDHALVFVHGFNNTFEAALFRTAQIAYDLEFDGAPFLYSWPSQGQVGFQDYSYDRESTGQAEPYFRQFLDLVTRESGATSVSVIGHSMGNQLLLSVLRDIRRSAPAGVTIQQVILAAPDVDRDAFEFLAKEIAGVSQGITLLAASNDRALEISRRFWGGVPRAGDVPASGPIIVPGIDTIDISATSTEVFAINHNGYAEQPALLSDMQLLIRTGLRPPERRVPGIERIKTDKGEYWRYPRGG